MFQRLWVRILFTCRNVKSRRSGTPHRRWNIIIDFYLIYDSYPSPFRPTNQCDQVARLFFNIWPLITMLIGPIALKVTK